MVEKQRLLRDLSTHSSPPAPNASQAYILKRRTFPTLKRKKSIFVPYECMYNYKESSFSWDEYKNHANQEKHGISFEDAQNTFLDPKRIAALDVNHRPVHEKRYYCIGKIGNEILTVCFTYRISKIRIIGAGYWRKGKKTYEKEA